MTKKMSRNTQNKRNIFIVVQTNIIMKGVIRDEKKSFITSF